AWCVSTNTDTWNGGSSPHQASAFGSPSHGPEPPLNIRRPITTAPPEASDSANTSESCPSSPPSRPCDFRQLAVASTHSCRPSPPRPSGSSSVWLGPATYPSSETEMSTLTLLMAPPFPNQTVSGEKTDRCSEASVALDLV